MKKVLHVITSLDTGGAQMMLFKLLKGMRQESHFVVEVVSLTSVGPVGEHIRALGIPVTALGMQRGVPDLRSMLRLIGHIRRFRADVVQTWMYHADLMGGIAAKLAGTRAVVWNIRHSTLNPEGDKPLLTWTVRVCAKLSRWIPSKIIVCSETAQETHVQVGYYKPRMRVIPNGFELEQFRPDAKAREAVRQELGLSPKTLLIGLIARFHPQKDHHTFVKAASALLRVEPDIHFILCGEDISWGNQMLEGWIDEADIRNRFHLLGWRDDLPQLTASLDIATMCSFFGEAFPNVVGEAMACGVPCVVTNVGDAAAIVGKTGRVVSPQNPLMLAAAWHELIDIGYEGRAMLGQMARERVAHHFNLPVVVAQYKAIYQEV